MKIDSKEIAEGALKTGFSERAWLKNSHWNYNLQTHCRRTFQGVPGEILEKMQKNKKTEGNFKVISENTSHLRNIFNGCFQSGGVHTSPRSISTEILTELRNELLEEPQMNNSQKFPLI